MLEVIGGPTLVPDASNEQVKDKSSSQWRCGEAWRVINVFNSLLSSKDNKPVAKLMQASAAADSTLSAILFPTGVVKQLRINENNIVDNGHDWIGRPVLSKKQGEQDKSGGKDKQETKDKAGDQNKPADKNKQGNKKQGAKQPKEEPVKQGTSVVSPARGVSLLHADAGKDKGVRYYQAGACGPVSLEACFIFATQMAGINWSKVRDRMTPEHYDKGVYWLSLLKPGADAVELFEEWPSHGYRILGRSAPRGKNATHDPDAGFYLAVSGIVFVPRIVAF